MSSYLQGAEGLCGGWLRGALILTLANHCAGAHRFEKVEEAKRAMRKKAELEQRFRVNGENSGSDSDLEDEDKITEQEEAGARAAAPRTLLCPCIPTSCKLHSPGPFWSRSHSASAPHVPTWVCISLLSCL